MISVSTIVAWRQALGMSQREFALDQGCSLSHVQKIEQGQRSVPNWMEQNWRKWQLHRRK